MRRCRPCVLLAATTLAAAAAIVEASGACPYTDAGTRCAAALGYQLPDINAALAADRRVPAITMYGPNGATADLLKLTPFTDIIKMLDKYGDRSLSECSPNIFKGKQMSEELTFDNTFAACPLAPLNKSASYVTGGVPRLTDIYPERLTAFPKIKAFVQAMKPYGSLVMLCVGLQPCNGQLTLTLGINPLVATPRFQIGPLSAWTHFTGFAYSSGGTFTPPEWAATPPPPFWTSDPLNLQDIGAPKPMSLQGSVYVQGPHSAGTMLSGNISLPGVAVKMGYQTSGFTLLNRANFVLARSEYGFEATLWGKLGLQLRWLRKPSIAVKGSELWLSAAGQQVTLDLSKRAWTNAYLPINRFLVFNSTYGSQWMTGGQLYVGPTGASLRLNVGNTPPIPAFSTTLTDVAAQLLGMPKIVGNFSMIFKARAGSDWMQFAVEINGKVTPMPFCRSDADCPGAKCGGTNPPICVPCLTDDDCAAGYFCQVSASLPFARRFVCAEKASSCPYRDAPTACVTPTYALPDVRAALAADPRVPALTMTGFDGKTTGDLLEMVPFADIVDWLNGNGNRSLHDCSLPVLTGEKLMAQASNPIYAACPNVPLAAAASYVAGAIPSLPTIPREQVNAAPAMLQFKQGMGQYGPRLAVCMGLQPCSGAPSVVMGLTDLTARVKAKLGAFGLETKLEGFAYSPGGGFIPPAWRGFDPPPCWSCDPTAPTAGTTQTLSKQGPVFLGGGPGGTWTIPGIVSAAMESQPSGFVLLNKDGFTLVQADHGPVLSLWGGRLSLTMRGFPQPVMAAKGSELWLHADGPIDPQLIQRMEPSINFALSRFASLAQQADSLDVYVGPKGAAVRLVYGGGATPSTEAATALSIPATEGPLTAVFAAAVGAFRFESAFQVGAELAPLTFCQNSADCPEGQMCGADSGWPRQPFCRACFDDWACGAGQRCNTAPAPQPVVRGLPRGALPWTCYASGTFTSLPACTSGARRGGFYLPRGWESQEPLPMAVILHPYASSGQDFLNAFFQGWADTNKFLVVAPSSAGDNWDWRYDPAEVMSCVNAAKVAAGVAVNASAVLAAGFQGGATFAPYVCTSYRAFKACAMLHGKLGNTDLYGNFRPNAWVSTARDDASNTPADAAAVALEFQYMGMSSVTLRKNYEGRAAYVHQELQNMLAWWLTGDGSQPVW
ncbi:hypothetical protein ABPG75_008403 [Micractinium tetrahymenae]